MARTLDAILNDDLDGFCACLSLPMVVESFEGSRVLATPEQVKSVFDKVRHRYVSAAVTDIVRRVVVAEFRTESRLEVTHETRLMNGTVLVEDAYPTFSVVVLEDGAWRIQCAIYALDETHPLSRVFAAASLADD